jgi:hypothetical protein
MELNGLKNKIMRAAKLMKDIVRRWIMNVVIDK